MEKILNIVTGVLVLVGALNWGLVGAFEFNLVEVILGAGTVVTKAVYILVGLSAVYMAYQCKKCNYCMPSK